MQAAIVHEPLDLHPRNGPGLAPFRTLTQFMQVIYWSSQCRRWWGMLLSELLHTPVLLVGAEGPRCGK